MSAADIARTAYEQALAAAELERLGEQTRVTTNTNRWKKFNENP